MINVRAAREAFENEEIFNIGWIKTEENDADGLTTQKRYDALERMMVSELLHK